MKRGISSFLFQALISEESAGANGILQNLDPRIKLVLSLALVILLSLVHSILLFAGIVLICLIFSLVSRIRFKAYIGRVWIPAAIFGGLVSLPATINIFIPGEPLLVLWKFSGPVVLGPIHIQEEIAVTHQGVISFLTLFLRIAATLSAVILVSMTTKWQDALRALQDMGVPRSFILILAITYRYIFLFVHLLDNRNLALRSRTIVEHKKGAGRATPAAASAGALLKKYIEKSEQLHGAMVSRGFHGF